MTGFPATDWRDQAVGQQPFELHPPGRTGHGDEDVAGLDQVILFRIEMPGPLRSRMAIRT